jgi:hypothetical protein
LSYKGQPVIGFATIASDLKSTALPACFATIVVALFNIDGDVFASTLAANNLELFAQPSNFVVFGESGYFHLCNTHTNQIMHGASVLRFCIQSCAVVASVLYKSRFVFRFISPLSSFAIAFPFG